MILAYVFTVYSLILNHFLFFSGKGVCTIVATPLFIAGKVFCDEGMAVQLYVMLESFGFSLEILSTLPF